MIASPIRILLVDDSELVREILRDILQHEQDIIVIGEASNGLEAVEKARLLKPDLITMDLMMPVMGGMEAISAIMCSKAVPILVVSGVADAQKAFEAVKRGALDVVNKPDGDTVAISAFVAKVRMLAGVSVITHIRPVADPDFVGSTIGVVPAQLVSSPDKKTVSSRPFCGSQKVFTIASSTGGPQALATILPQLPSTFPCPILIAQHIAEGFAAGMVSWLAGICEISVRLAVNGEEVRPGIVYIAPPEYHCIVTVARRIAFIDRQERDIYHPSCDQLLESIANVYQADAVGIILTGMGHDGSMGMARIRANGGITLAQDAKTSLIYGMNRCAIESGSVQKQLPETAIATEMLRLAEVIV